MFTLILRRRDRRARCFGSVVLVAGSTGEKLAYHRTKENTNNTHAKSESKGLISGEEPFTWAGPMLALKRTMVNRPARFEYMS
jgi:hypothetical protein